MRRSKVLKASASIALGILLIVVAVIFSAAMLVQSAWFHRQLEERASKALGREVTIGDFVVDWFWPPRLEVDDLTIANADWASEADFATIGHAEIVVAPFELLRGRLVVPELIVENPTVNLERSADDDVNWQMIEGNDDEQGEATIPIVHQLDITNASISYADSTSGDDFGAEVDTLSLRNGNEGLEGSSEGTIEQTAYQLDLAAGSLESLNDESEPYPLTADFRFGQTAIEASGTIAHPLETPEPQLTVSAKGEDLGELSALAMTGIPSTPGYELTGQVSGDAGTWRLDDFQAKLGRSDLSGTLAIDTRSDPLAIDGDLVADRVDLVEIRDIFDVPPPAEVLGEAAEDDGLIMPADALDLSPLRVIDGRLSLDIKHLATPYLPIDDLITELTIDGALLRAQPAEFGIGGGAVRVFLSAYGAKDPPGLDLLTYVRDLPVAQLFENTEFAQEMGGKLDGQVALEGRGNTYHSFWTPRSATSTSS